MVKRSMSEESLHVCVPSHMAFQQLAVQDSTSASEESAQKWPKMSRAQFIAEPLGLRSF